MSYLALVDAARQLRHETPSLSPALAAKLDELLDQAARDLSKRFLRGKIRQDARGRLRTFCLNMRINAVKV